MTTPIPLDAALRLHCPRRSDLDKLRRDPTSRMFGVPRDIVEILRDYAFESELPQPWHFAEACSFEDCGISSQNTEITRSHPPKVYESVQIGDYTVVVVLWGQFPYIYLVRDGYVLQAICLRCEYVVYVGGMEFHVCDTEHNMLILRIEGSRLTLTADKPATTYRLGLVHYPMRCGLTLIRDFRNNWMLHDYTGAERCKFVPIEPIAAKPYRHGLRAHLID